MILQVISTHFLLKTIKKQSNCKFVINYQLFVLWVPFSPFSLILCILLVFLYLLNHVI